MIEEKDKQLREKDIQLQEKDRQLQEKDRQLKEKDGQLKEKDGRLQEKDKKLDVLLKKLEHLERVVAHIHDKVCDDVVLSCTMTGFKQLKDNKAQLFSQKQWFSPPYFTHLFGYKMCFEIYLDSFAEPSLHIHTYIMKGPYDDFLQWPFKGKVIIRLLNQCGDEDHYNYIFDYKDNDGKRVTTGERGNYLTTQSICLPLNQLGCDPKANCQYLKDDCLMFKVIIPL